MLDITNDNNRNDDNVDKPDFFEMCQLNVLLLRLDKQLAECDAEIQRCDAELSAKYRELSVVDAAIAALPADSGNPCADNCRSVVRPPRDKRLR